MILKAITIENFKGIREPVRVELKPVTLLFGANSAGKSTVVQALHYAQEIFERHNVDPGRTLIGGEAIKLGGFETLVHGHDRTKPILLRIDLDLSQTELPIYRLPYVTSHSDFEIGQEQEITSGWVEVKVVWSDLLGRPVLEEYSVGINEDLFARIRASMDLRQIEVNWLNLEHPVFTKEMTYSKLAGIEDMFEDYLPDSGANHSVNNLLMFSSEVLSDRYMNPLGISFGLLGLSDAIPVFGKPLDIQPDVFQENIDPPLQREFIESISKYVVGIGELARDALRSFRYLGPLREVPSRNFDAERSPDESRWAHGLGAWDVLSRADPAFISSVNEWFEDEQHLNAGYRVELKRYKELDIESPLFIALQREWTLDEELPLKDGLDGLPVRSRLLIREIRSGVEVQPQDVGVGISQLLPVIVAALQTPKGIVAIEQPELHIHPAWQVVLGDLFLSQAKKRDVIFLLETHSEHLMLRLLRRIRETHEGDLPPGAPEATPDDVAVLFIESVEDGAKITPLPINESGDFDEKWPRGFFKERAEELF